MRTQFRSIEILGFTGSLRKDSFNKLLLKAAGRLLGDNARLELFDISKIPLYNQDVEMIGIPEPVRKFKDAIERADAILVATPEFNHSYPGVLKNAIDWASRPFGQNSFDGKPVAVTSAGPGMFGGLAAQDQLKQVLLALNMRLVTQPPVIVALAHQKFDSEGNLVDADTKRFLQQLLSNLIGSVNRLDRSERLLTAATPIVRR